MNYRFHKYSDNQKLTNYWDLGIIHDSGETLYHSVYYDYDLNQYYVYRHDLSLEIIEYLISNNICTLHKHKQNNTISKLIINPHIALELI
jgi:phosphosulfolactate synthase (CoM biosynthesis protein A)